MSRQLPSAERIRVIAIAILRRGSDVLVFPVHGSDGRVKGWRPLGGGVEPGETAEETLQRELLEEIGSAVSGVRQIAVLENIFQHEGKAGHEIVFVFEAQLEKRSLLARDTVTMNENGEELIAHWVSIESFRTGVNTLFPLDLTGLI